jgi:DNA-binding NtrC family response regulator
MDRSRVLVVEDHPAVLKLLGSILDDAYDVVTASDGEQALERVADEPLDVVLSDVRMPGVSGFEVLRAVRQSPLRASVVMMTAYANVPDAVAAMRLGASDYIAKPLEADEVLLVVARAAQHALEHDDRRSAPLRSCREPGCVSVADLTDVAMGFHRAVEDARDRASREYLAKLMRVFDGNVTQAARQAGMTRESLHRVMRKYGARSGHRDQEAENDAGSPGGQRGGVAR